MARKHVNLTRPRDSLQPLTFGMGLPNSGQLHVVRLQPFLERQKLLVELPEQLVTGWSELGSHHGIYISGQSNHALSAPATS